MSAVNSFKGAGLLDSINKHNDIVLACVIIAVISLMIFPIPLFILDLLIAVNIAASVMLLMLALYVPSALHLSTFPALLLFTTLFRLSLNIASTKQILLKANAGHIIETFGSLVVGGNVIVGLVVFLIIAIVQFIVIAKGSERVAEVGARFTLDAMPGKQMSIDADVRANLITGEEAKKRRGTLEMESKLHGAMDGAMKFVKGDAIAGIIISFVNILAGMAIGSLMHGMAIADAINRYTILAVGDGMVSQIPSLFVSVAAGILITRVSNESEAKPGHLGGEIGSQLMAHPMALLITGGVLFGFVLVPGFPKFQFGAVGVLVLFVGWLVRQELVSRSGTDHALMPAMKREGAVIVPPFISRIEDLPSASPLCVELGAESRLALDPEKLDTALQSMRNRLKLDLGLPFPGLHFTQGGTLDASAYRILAHELEAARGNLFIHQVLVDSAAPERDGAVRHPGLPPMRNPVWRAAAHSNDTMDAALAPESVVAAHLEHIVRIHASSFIGMQEVQGILNSVQSLLPDLSGEVLRALPLQRVADVMRRLVDEGVSIRPVREILESLVTWGPKEKDVVMLTEHVRIALGRFISNDMSGGTGALRAIMLDAEWEDALRQSIQPGVGASFIVLPPDQSERLIAAIRALLPAPEQQSLPHPVLLVSMDIRRYLKLFLADYFSVLPVLSYQEISAATRVEAAGQIAY